MIPTISSTQMREIIEEALKYGDKKPLLFLGKTGIGKSQITADIARENNLGHIDIRILNHTETDFKGLPYPDKEREFTVYLQNKMLPRVERDGERGILVLDEITSGYRSVRTAIYQLMQERCIGDYKLPDGWQIICLGNGENDGGDFNGIESAFGARCRCFRVDSTVNDYLDYGNKAGVNDLVLSFLEFSPKSLHTYNSDLDGTEECLGFACNRAWSGVSDILNRKGITMDNGELSLIDKINIRGCVGEQEGQMFCTFADKKKEVVSCIDIANGKKVIAPKTQEVLYMTASGIKSLMAELTNSSEFGRNITDHPSQELITQIANCIYWLIQNTTIELVMSTVTGYCSKTPRGMELFVGDDFDDFCDKSDKYRAINEFFESHLKLIAVD